MAQTISIRTVAELDAEILRLQDEIAAMGEACSWQDARIDSDEFDGGIVRKQQHAGALHNGTHLAAARNARKALGHERLEMREAIAELRAERRLWTDRTPLGMLEIASMLGYGPDAPRQWKRRNVLPAPAGCVSGTPYWWRGDILGWALEHGRTRAIVSFDPTWDEPTYYEEAV